MLYLPGGCSASDQIMFLAEVSRQQKYIVYILAYCKKWSNIISLPYFFEKSIEACVEVKVK